jgi:hydrogenase maturation protease
VLPAPADGGTSAGTLRILKIRAEDLEPGGPLTPAGLAVNPGFDPHGMDPLAVLRRLRVLGGSLPETYLVGCIAGRTDDGMELSEEVSRAVPAAVEAVRTLVTARLSFADAATADAATADAATASAGPDAAG